MAGALLQPQLLLGSQVTNTTQMGKGTAYTGVTAGTSEWIPILGGPANLTFGFASIGTTSGGTLLIEETDDPADVSTASVVYTESASAFTGGVKQLVHVAIGSGLWVRVRISSAITGGGSVYVSISGV